MTDQAVQITVGDQTTNITGLLAAKAARDKKLTSWLNMVTARYQIRNITLDGGLFIGDNMLFGMVITDATVEGKKIPNAAFVRGGAAAAWVELFDETSGEEFIAFTEQERFPIGRRLCEIFAGMTDEGGKLPVAKIFATLARELNEESGEPLPLQDAIYLGRYYSSPGGTDEEIGLCAVKIKTSKEKIDSLRNRHTGEAASNEAIVVRVEPKEVALNLLASDPKAMIAYGRLMGTLPIPPEDASTE